MKPTSLVVAVACAVSAALLAPAAVAATGPQLTTGAVNADLAGASAAASANRAPAVKRHTTHTTPKKTVTVKANDLTVMGVTWKGSDPGSQYRVLEHGIWGQWTDMPADDGGGPDAKTAEGSGAVDGTEPLLLNAGQQVQVRSAKPAAATKSLAVEAFETPTSGADAAAAGSADTAQGELSATAENAAASGQAAGSQGANVQNVAAKSANIPNLGRIVTRAGWGANEKLVRCKADTTDVNKALIIHHTSGATSYSRSQVPGILRGYLEFHTKGRKWCDLGYNMLVDRFGTIYEGRRGAPYSGRPVVGAHASGFNTHTFGVSVMGTFNSRQPSAAAVKSVKRIATWQAVKWGWNPGGKVKLTAAKGDTVKYKPGTVVTKSTIFGHRDTSYTDCPGTKFYAMLPSIRKSVAASAKKAGPKYAIAGAIRTYYYTHNGTVTIGMPTGREAAKLRSGGARQSFAKSTLTWSRATKVQPVVQGFLTAYRKLGYEKSKLGYPTGAERKVKGLARQDFQGGSMVWQKGRAVIAYNNKVKAVK